MYKMAQIIKKKQYKISKSPKEQTIKRGGGLKTNTLQLLLEATYTGNEVDGFILDKEISTNETRVFVNPNAGHIVVAHTGTIIFLIGATI